MDSKKKFRAPAQCLVILLFSVFGLPTVDAATLRIEPQNLTLAVGEKKLVQVIADAPAPATANDPVGLAAFQFTAAFTAATVSVTNPNEAFRPFNIPPYAPLGGNPFCAAVRGTTTCTDPPWVLTSTGRAPTGRDESTPGRVQVAYGTSGTQAPPTGMGVIALLELTGQSDGCTTLQLSDVILADNSGVPRRYETVVQGARVCAGTGAVCELEVNPAMVDFGRVPVGMTAERTVELKAAETGGDCTVSAALGAGAGAEWALPEGPVANKTLAAGDSVSVRITYTPSAVISSETTVEISSNDPDQPSLSVPVKGKGGTCTPGAEQACYEGPPDTEGVGQCRAGVQRCADDGSGFGPCLGQVLPVVEGPFDGPLCADGLDNDCDALTDTADPNCVQPRADHFLCYQVKETKGGRCVSTAPLNPDGQCANEEACGGVTRQTQFCQKNKFPTGVTVFLDDQFEEKRFDVQKPAALCTPADKNGEGIIDRITHLKGYQIKETSKVCVGDAPQHALGACKQEEDCGGQRRVTSFCQATPKHVPQRFVTVTNQFGAVLLDTTKPDRLLVLTAKDLQHPVAAPELSLTQLDHFKCYATKVLKHVCAANPTVRCKTDADCTAAGGSCNLGFPKGVQALVEDQFAQPKLYDVQNPTRLCNPVDKNDEGIKDPNRHLMCYQVAAVKKVCAAGSTQNMGAACKKEEDCGGVSRETSLCVAQAKHTPVTRIFVNNQLGPEILDTIGEEELCVPSEKRLP
jgi:hypothetical protein